MQIINWFIENSATLAAGLLAVLGGFSILARLTPTPKDDKIIAKLQKIIHTFGLTKKNDE